MLYIVIVAAAVAVGLLAWNPAQPGSGAGHVTIQPQQYLSEFIQPDTPHLLVDVRTPEEFNSGHIEGAVNISLQSLLQRLDEIPQDQPVVVYCRSGIRSSTAAQQLARAGYNDIYDLGGIITWQAQGLPVQ